MAFSEYMNFNYPQRFKNNVKDSDLAQLFEEATKLKNFLKLSHFQGLFDPEEIKHARDTILYLISKQGAKATHFQVNNLISMYKFL